MGRTRSILRIALIALAVIAIARPAVAQESGIGLPVGATPEAPTVEDLDGNAIDLSQWVGKKPVLIEFWATWCALCKALEPHLEEAHRRYGDKVEFLIVGVGVSQTPRSIRRHIEDHAPPGRMLFDRRGTAARAFAAPTTSYIVLLDAQGRVTYTGSGEGQPVVEVVGKLAGAGN